MTESSNLIARQPICNKSLKVIGFEILYRMQGDHNNAAIDNPDAATIDVILALFNDLAIEDVVGDKKAFINFTSNLLIKGLPDIPPKQLVIELLEDQKITPSLLKSLARFRKQGYKIALDDFCLNKETISLIDYANIIKLDVMTHTPESWSEYIPLLKEKGVALLAEKVETYEVYERCCALGFQYFQGYFFSKPKIIAGKRMNNNEMTIINLLNEVNRSSVDFEKTTQLISQDVNLSYNLLRTINSGLFALQTQVTSIKHAITLLGLSSLKNWINLLSLSSLNNKPEILTDLVMLRARMCELIGQKITGHNKADDFFTVGLLSLIDAFFDMPMQTLLDKLSLSKNIKSALLHRQGDIGLALESAINYQTGDWKQPGKVQLIQDKRITEQELTNIYLDSIHWVEANHN
ncbi:MAG: EAL domain-containing protein [Cellvibrionaceae bacterium]|nr:EAL domain-containing protein [Cellvibrionaceae bacterium]